MCKSKQKDLWYGAGASTGPCETYDIYRSLVANFKTCQSISVKAENIDYIISPTYTDIGR